MDEHRDFHPIEALTVTANEVVSPRIIEEYEVLATGPVPYSTIHGAVVIPGFVDHKHIVLVLLIPKCCIKQTISSIYENGSIQNAKTDRRLCYSLSKMQ